MSDFASIKNPAYSTLVRSIRMRALRLLDLQLWCMGRDVRHLDNLLLRYGFERRRPPEKINGGSEYVLHLPDEGHLTLWGYGVHIAHPGESGLFLKRYGFAPRWTAPGFVPAQCWHVSAWKRARTPRTTEESREVTARLSELAAWIAEYERWILHQTGLAYRERVLDQWHKESVVPANAIAQSWEELAKHFTLTEVNES